MQDVIHPDDLRRQLIDYRAKKNLTLRALATLIGGITGATLGNIERGSTWPRRLTICKLERFLRRQGVFDGGRRKDGT